MLYQIAGNSSLEEEGGVKVLHLSSCGCASPGAHAQEAQAPVKHLHLE